jgi:hypothetical protein
MSMAEDLISALADLQETEALNIVREKLSAGEDPLIILDAASRSLGI